VSDSFDLQEQLARIRRAQEESDKFAAEQKKLMAEQEKLYAEERKLFAEALKLQRERLLSPWLFIVATIGGLGGLTAGVAAIVNLLRAAH
jgi:hypothetical protein